MTEVDAATAGKEPVEGGNAGMGTQYLEVRGLTVAFDGFKAVNGVDLTLFQGDLRFLIGPNGAGKTTVIDALTGLVPANGSASKSGVEAFAHSLRTGGPAKVRMLYQHFAHEPIGVWQVIRENARGLYVRGRLITDTQRGRECLALLGEGALNGLSIGFRTVRARRDAKTGLRHLLEIELWEISVVTFPLLAQSQVTAVGAAAAAANEIRRATAALRS